MSSPLRIGVVVSGWPRVSETFAINELLALEAAGVLGLVAATKPGDLALVQPAAHRLTTPVHFLPEGDEAEQVAALVELARGRVNALHGYFAHRPAAVARGAAQALDLPFGFSAHALDVRKISASALADQCAEARTVVSCNGDTAAVLEGAGAQVLRLAHGVDTTAFPATAPRPCGDVLELLAVGRLVPKKGFDVLIDALGRLRCNVRLRIVGEGPERARLVSQIDSSGLGDRVELAGRCTHDQLPALIAACDVVVVPSVVDSNGDRDGLPNVVLEAMASQRPVIASDVAAISSAVHHESTGLLVRPGDPLDLASAIDRLASAPGLRSQIAHRARLLVEDEFELSACTARLIKALEVAYV